MRDGRDVKDRKSIGGCIKARVIAERAFHLLLVRINVTFDHNLGIRGRFDRLADALHEFDRLAAQIAGQQILVDVRWQRRGGRPHRRRIAAERNRTRNL